MTLTLAQENLGVSHNFFSGQATIFSGAGWTKHGFHTGPQKVVLNLLWFFVLPMQLGLLFHVFDGQWSSCCVPIALFFVLFVLQTWCWCLIFRVCTQSILTINLSRDSSNLRILVKRECIKRECINFESLYVNVDNSGF